MATLAQIALRQLPLVGIQGQEILNLSLPPEQLEKIKDKITLDNLYQEDIISPDLDISLFRIAVIKSIPNLLWSYISQWTKKDFYHHQSPFTANGAYYLQRSLQITPDQTEEIISSALELMVADLSRFLSKSGFSNYYGDLIIVWSRVFDSHSPDLLWKILSIRSAYVTEEEADFPEPTQTFYYRTLDDMLIGIFDEMQHYGVITTLDQSANPNELNSSLKLALMGMKESLKAETENLFRDLKKGIIILENNFQLALNIFKQGIRLYAMGRYLHIVEIIEDEDNPVFRTEDYFYTREDAILILASIFIKGNISRYIIDPFYA